MTYEEALELAISVLHDTPDIDQHQEAAEVLDKSRNFSDSVGYCQLCGKWVAQ